MPPVPSRTPLPPPPPRPLVYTLNTSSISSGVESPCKKTTLRALTGQRLYGIRVAEAVFVRWKKVRSAYGTYVSRVRR